jgi:hypothetical protein
MKPKGKKVVEQNYKIAVGESERGQKKKKKRRERYANNG